MNPIKTDDDLVVVINDLKHYLKDGIPYSPMRSDFNNILNEFIVRWKLDTDSHTFASMPVKKYLIQVWHEDRSAIAEEYEADSPEEIYDIVNTIDASVDNIEVRYNLTNELVPEFTPL